MLKKGLCLLIGIMMLFCQINVVHATNLASGAESAILIDAQSQQVLYQKKANKNPECVAFRIFYCQQRGA